MAVVELDVPQLASFCSVPETSVNALLDQPTAELVRNLLEGISAKAQEYEELKSDKLRLDVELENAVRGGDTKSRALKSSVEKAQKESTGLRKQLKTEQETRASAQADLEKLRTSTSSATSEISSLQARVSSLESSNRDTLSLLDSKSVAYDNLAEELNIQHHRTVELRKQVSELEQCVQSANAASSNAQFHEQGLQQEIEQLKRSNDWLDKELKTKSDEYSKYRKEKSLRISELQRQNEDITGEVDTLKKTENNLRHRLDELNEKADDAFQRIQQMEEAVSRKEEAFRLELDAASRLQELTKKSADTEQHRQKELLAELENAKEDASEQLGMLGAELETEHREREASEARVAELEVQLERIQGDLSNLRERGHEGATPHQGLNGFVPRTPVRGDESPRNFSPGSSRHKGGLSMTQIYSNYNDVARQLEGERRRNEKLAGTIDEMIQEMEVKGPELEELKADHSRLESEVENLSSLVNEVGQERDQATKAAKRWEGQVNAKVREGEVLRQQLRDLSSQIKVLLMEAHLQSQGQGQISIEERARLEQIAHGQIDEERVEGESDTSRFISESLVTFRDVTGLQDQNVNLLKITREVGEKLEHEEALRKQTETARDWEDLQQKYERCKDEIRSLATQSQSYIRERDMFRRMLSHRGQIPRGHESMFDESIVEEGGPATSGQSEVLNSTENLSSQNVADYSKLLKDMQAHFDAYKQEAATDNKTLKDQVDSVSRENSQLRSDTAKSNSQVSLAHERYEMLQANYNMLKNENAELQKRSQIYSDNAAKQDLRVQQVAEDLVEARGLVESMRNETANLKAEKDFWKTIEKRIMEDNESLLNERGRLNSLNANLQNLLNEREYSENELRRRLHAQIETLEKELQTTKTRLAEESEENKRATQRREYDYTQSQKRIDDLVSSLGSLREELAVAKTSRDHLATRVDELTIALRSAEERVTVLNATPVSTAANNEQSTINGAHSASISKEQELAMQVSELKRDLDLIKAELENAKEQVEQYKSISQSSEDELTSLNETQDLYRQETEKFIEDKDAKIRQLEQRVEDTTSELTSTTNELSELRNDQAEHGRRLEEHRTAFKTELSQLKDQDDRHAAAAQYYQEDLKVQADIAQQAQQNYENELVKHADAAKALQKIRGDFNDLKLEIVEAKTETESARATLSQNEESWTESKDRLEREMNELKSARQDLKTQNEHLHKQLEAFHTRTQMPVANNEKIVEESADSGLDSNLQEVIKYLRREKEIVDVQFELSSQEAKRLKQQLDYAQSQLDDTRLKLNQQRRVEAESERTALDHNKLMETINDLNTLRESNVTLRAESRQSHATLVTRTQEVDSLRTQIEPLQAQIREITEKCENQEGEARLLKENCDRWQQRAQNVLQKYDRVDPAELEALKEQLKTVSLERDELVASKQALQEQFNGVSAQIIQAQEQSNERVETMKARLTEQFKSRSKQLSDRIKERDNALQTAMTERQQLEERVTEMANAEAELNTLRDERDAAVQKAESIIVTGGSNAGASTRSTGEDGEVHEGLKASTVRDDLQTLQRQVREAEDRARLEESRSNDLKIEAAASKSKIAQLESQIVSLQQRIEALSSELNQLRNTQQLSTMTASSETEEQLRKLQDDLAQAQKEADDLRTSASVTASLSNAPQGDESKSVADQVAEHVAAVRAELETRHNERVEQNDEQFKQKTKNMAAQLSKKLHEGKAQIRESLQGENGQLLERIRGDHSLEIQRLQAQHQKEIDELRQLEEAKFAELKSSSQSVPQAPTSSGGTPEVKAEGQKPPSDWRPSEQEIKTLIQSSDFAKGLLRANVTRQVNKTKEELTAQFKEEHAKDVALQINDLQVKADAAKEHAVALAGKKSSLQLNLATNKARGSQFKLDLVQKAAQETPQKPIQEVWIAVKDAKPPTAAPGAAPAGPSAQGAQQAPTPTTTSTFGRPTPAIQPARTGSPQSQPTNDVTKPQGSPPSVPTFGRSTPAGPALQAQAQSSNAQPSQAQKPTPIQPASNIPNGPQQSAPTQPASSTITGLAQGGRDNNPNAGTGPAALRGLSSGIPRGGSTRGNPSTRGNSANQRGRGSGIARGAPQHIDTNRTQGAPQGRGSPNSALNAGAKQFVPGNKRPREEGQEAQGSDGKRIRGGRGGN